MCEDLSVGLSDPFREEEFLVQSRDEFMDQATNGRQDGVFANIRFRFPRKQFG